MTTDSHTPAPQDSESAIPEPLSAGKTAAVIILSFVVMVALSFGSIAAASALQGPAALEGTATEAPSGSSAAGNDEAATEEGASDQGAATVDDRAAAAVVNGEPILEKDVTAYIDQFRQEMQLTDDAAWGEWLVGYGYTPESVRQDVINGFVYEALYEMAAEELQVQVTQEDIDEALAEIKSQYESEEEYQQSLADFGITEESFVQNELRPSLLEGKIIEAALGDKADDEEAFYEWLDNYWELKGVTINDMPDGLPYAIDLTPYEQAAAEAGDGSEEGLVLGDEGDGVEGDEGELDLSEEDLAEGDIVYLDEDGNEISLEDLEIEE